MVVKANMLASLFLLLEFISFYSLFKLKKKKKLTSICSLVEVGAKQQWKKPDDIQL